MSTTKKIVGWRVRWTWGGTSLRMATFDEQEERATFTEDVLLKCGASNIRLINVVQKQKSVCRLCSEAGEVSVWYCERHGNDMTRPLTSTVFKSVWPDGVPCATCGHSYVDHDRIDGKVFCDAGGSGFSCDCNKYVKGET